MNQNRLRRVWGVLDTFLTKPETQRNLTKKELQDWNWTWQLLELGTMWNCDKTVAELPPLSFFAYWYLYYSIVKLGAPEALRWEIKILPAYKSIPKPLPSNLQPDLFLPGKDKKTSVSINLPNLLPSWSPDCQNTSSNSNSFEFVVRAVVLDAAAGKPVR